MIDTGHRTLQLWSSEVC